MRGILASAYLCSCVYSTAWWPCADPHATFVRCPQSVTIDGVLFVSQDARNRLRVAPISTILPQGLSLASVRERSSQGSALIMCADRKRPLA